MAYDPEHRHLYGYVKSIFGTYEAAFLDFTRHPVAISLQREALPVWIHNGSGGYFPVVAAEEKRVFGRTQHPFRNDFIRLAPPPPTPPAVKGQPPIDFSRSIIDNCGIMQERAVYLARGGFYPLMENDNKELAWRTEIPRNPYAAEHTLCFDSGFARLNNGTDVLIWNKRAYVSRNGLLEEYCKAPMSDNYHSFSYAPWGEDGFYFLSKRCIFRVRPGIKPEACVPHITNVAGLSEGPDGSVLITQFNNKENDAVKWWLPDEDLVISLSLDYFDLAPLEDGRRVYVMQVIWQKEVERIALLFQGEIRSISLADARAQPSRRASEG